MTYENNIIKSKLNKYMTVQTYTNVTLVTKKKITFTNKQKNIYKHMTKIYIYYKQVDF
jgi:hypothetical protein